MSDKSTNRNCAFVKACELGFALGWRDIKDLPGC